MSHCWNCQRACEKFTRTCPYCGAALPVVYGPEPPPAPAPVEEAAPAPEVRRPAPRARSEFTLNDPGSLRERAAESTGFYAEKAAEEISHLRMFLRAMEKNSQAAAVLTICVCIVVYIGLVGTKPSQLGMMDASSMKQAMDGQLFQRQAIPSVETIVLGPLTIKIDEAWIAQIGRFDKAGFLSNDIVAVPSGQYRMYFRITVTGGADTLEFLAGKPQAPVAKLNLVRDGAPVVLRAIDLPSFVNPPQSVLVRDTTHPDYGAQLFKIH